MEILTFCFLAGFMAIAYLYGKRDLLSPWFLLCFMIFATYCVVLLNFRNWNVVIHPLFFLYLGTAIVSFGAAAAFVSKYAKKTAENAGAGKPLPLANEDRYPLRTTIENERPLAKYPAWIFAAASAVCAGIYIFKMFYDVRGAGSLSHKLSQIYVNVVDGYSPGVFFTQMLEIVVGLAYVSMYRFFLVLFCKRRGKNIKEAVKCLIPVAAFMLVSLVSTDRNRLLRFVFYAICLWILFYRDKHKEKRVNVKIAGVVFLMLLVAVALFYAFGKAKRYTSDLFRMVSIYSGSGLYNFNLWIQEFENTYYLGQATFLSLINSLGTLLNPLGIRLEGIMDRFDPAIEFVSPNGYCYSSNIYSALKPYVEDFGYFGAILFPFLMGAIFQALYEILKTNGRGLAWILYCQLIYSVLFFPIAEQFYRRLHLGYFYEIFWVAAIYYLAKAFSRRKCKQKTPMESKRLCPDKQDK